MRLLMIRPLIGAVLIVAGWTLGRAQARVGDFELEIDAVVGTTHVRCVRGCSLLGSRDREVTGKQPQATYTFGCSGPGLNRCSAKVNGFLQR